MIWQLATERALTVTHDPIAANTTSEGARGRARSGGSSRVHPEVITDEIVRFAGSCMTVLSPKTFERFVRPFERFERVPGEPPRDRSGVAASSFRRIAVREGVA